MEEVWKDIPGYEKIYQASNLGKIRTHKDKTTYSKRHGVRHWKQKVLKPKITKSTNGRKRYDARVELWKDGKHKTYLVSRLIGLTFLGESNLTINHIDGNPLNNRVDNLEWVSLKENIQKAFENNLYKQTKTLLYDKETNQWYEFRSMSRASVFTGNNAGYISNKCKRNIFENKRYKWSF